MKIALNNCYGGFSLSEKAYNLLKERAPEIVEGTELVSPAEVDEDGNTYNGTYYLREWKDNQNQMRTNPIIIQIIEELGIEEASGDCASVVIMEFPGETCDWFIDDDDGYEIVREVHRTWDPNTKESEVL